MDLNPWKEPSLNHYLFMFADLLENLLVGTYKNTLNQTQYHQK